MLLAWLYHHSRHQAQIEAFVKGHHDELWMRLEKEMRDIIRKHWTIYEWPYLYTYGSKEGLCWGLGRVDQADMASDPIEYLLVRMDIPHTLRVDKVVFLAKFKDMMTSIRDEERKSEGRRF